MTHSNPLVVEGAVGQPLSLDADDLARLDGQIPDVGTVVAGRTGAAVPLASILAAASPTDEATHLTLESTDGAFAASLPIELLEGGLLLYRLGDEPLPARFGGPFRFLLPDAVACHTGPADTCANVKFVGRITLSNGPGRDTREDPRDDTR